MPGFPKKTLTDRLWNEEPFIELMKIVGYSGRLASECVELAKPLLTKYGQPLMSEVSTIVCRITGNGNTAMAYLTDEVRKKAWPILGPDPENLPWWAKSEETLFGESARPGKKQSSQ